MGSMVNTTLKNTITTDLMQLTKDLCKNSTSQMVKSVINRLLDWHIKGNVAERID